MKRDPDQKWGREAEGQEEGVEGQGPGETGTWMKRDLEGQKLGRMEIWRNERVTLKARYLAFKVTVTPVPFHSRSLSFKVTVPFLHVPDPRDPIPSWSFFP
jgi:hypothetical protein